jgi:phosphoserine phosphatase
MATRTSEDSPAGARPSPKQGAHSPAHAPPFERIVFDCDSTLARIEGIEELAGAHKDEIAKLTEQAMSGAVPLEEVYARRLEITRPLRTQVALVGRRYIETAIPQAREVMAALKMLGKELRIVSGGLRMPVVTFAGWLGIGDDHVHAVQVWFDSDHRINRFDRENPLTKSGGKQLVVAGLPKKRTVVVGDGMTDAEAAEAADCFVCFTGVVERPDVMKRAHVVVSGPSAKELLPALCSPAELQLLARDPRHGKLVTPAL